jgi:hypothetical protein
MGGVEICREEPSTGRYAPVDDVRTTSSYDRAAVRRARRDSTRSLLAAPVSGGCFSFAPVQALVLAGYVLSVETSSSEDLLVDRMALALTRHGTVAVKARTRSAEAGREAVARIP